MKPTNLLFLLSDEHNRDCLGCYGHPLVQTPALDALAVRGVRFEGAYSNCPICVPARASLATGQYVHQIGYWDNAFPYEGRVPSWGHRLIDAGHRVDAIGKLHYRSATDQDGFSHKIVPLNVVDGIGDVMGAIREDPPIRTGTREGIRGAGPGTSTYLDYDIDIARRACQWLGEIQTNQPWVLLVSFVCPHPPFIAPPELFAKYPLADIPLPVQNRLDQQPGHPGLARLRQIMQYQEPFTEEQIRRVTAAYYGMCTHLDQQIGKVLRALEENGLAESTRVLYTSDHGESMGRRGLWGKFTMYEESVAVPLILAGPDVPEGQVCRDLVSLVDLYPTILEAVGVPLTEEEKNLPGASLWPIAKGQPARRPVFSEYHAVGSTSASYLLREGRYKYIHYVGYPPQLFDLQSDPQEINDLATRPEHQDRLAEMERKLRGLVDPEAVDARARADQQELIARHGGREQVLARGTFINSPVPGETPRFVAQKRPGSDRE
jgi:choline-sulfatase